MNAIPTVVAQALAPNTHLHGPVLGEPAWRERAEDWQRIASLHQALIGQDDLTATLGAFSTWLMPHVPHVLVGLLGPLPEPPLLVRASNARFPTLGEAAATLARRASPLPRLEILSEAGFSGLFWPLPVRSDGDRLLVLKPGDADSEERAVLHRSVRELLSPLKRAARFDALYREARLDPLTSLANRRAFDEALAREFERLVHNGSSATLVCCDLDHFKALNDQFGHPAGDAALQAVARTISSDVRSTDTVARLGGDEFALLLPDMSESGAELLAARLRTQVRKLTLGHPMPSRFGLSTGVAAWQADETAAEWFRRADEALYRAKAERPASSRPKSGTEAADRSPARTPLQRGRSLLLPPFDRLALHAAED